MRGEGRKGRYLLGLEHWSIVIGIEDVHYGHCRGGGAVPIHVCRLDGQRVLRDSLRRKGEWKATESSALGECGGEGNVSPSHNVLLTPQPTTHPPPQRTEAKDERGGTLPSKQHSWVCQGVTPGQCPLTVGRCRMGALSRNLVKGIN